MLHSETRNHSTDLFLKAPFCEFNLRLWLSVNRATSTQLPGALFSSIRASPPHLLSNFVPGACPIGKVHTPIYLLTFFFCEERKKRVKTLVKLPVFFPRSRFLGAFIPLFFCTPFQIECNHLRFLLGILVVCLCRVFCCSGCLSFPESTQHASGKRHHHQAINGRELQLDKNYNLRKEGTEILFFCLIFSTQNRYNDSRSQSKIMLIQTAVAEIFSSAGLPLELHLCP